MNLPPIVVFDCNIFLQAMLSSRGPAAACIDLFRRGEFAVAVSPFVLAEVRGLPSHPDLRRFASLTPERVERFIIELLRTVKMVQDVPAVFEYRRDPDDAHYVNLALAAEANMIVTRERDLLALTDAGHPDGSEFQRRFPALRIMSPEQLIREIASSKT